MHQITHRITLFPETKFKKCPAEVHKPSGDGDTPPHTQPHLWRLDPRFPRAYAARHPPPPFENPGSATVCSTGIIVSQFIVGRKLCFVSLSNIRCYTKCYLLVFA